jgi:hypothetical protein
MHHRKLAAQEVQLYAAELVYLFLYSVAHEC